MKPDRQQRYLQVEDAARRAGCNGVTVAELRDIMHLHHGSASSVLSTLHDQGRLTMLDERRNRCHVYVVPEHAGGRPEAPRRRTHVAGDAWTQGYDAGVAAAAAEVYESAVAEGRRMNIAAMERHMTAMRMEIMRSRIPRIHNRQCWMVHPECALMAMLRAAQRDAGIQQS